MRILFFIDSLGGGGAQRQLVNVAIGLGARGHAVGVHTYFPADWHLARLQASGVAYTCAEKSGRFDLRPIAALRRRYREFAPDVVIAFMRTPAFYAEALRFVHPSVPLIVSERAGVEVAGLQWTDLLAGLGHLLASHVTANSHDFIERIRRALPLGSRSSAIYNGVESHFFRAPRAAHATGQAMRFCVVAARVSRQKGPMPLARGLGLLAEAGIDCTLDWIGPTDESTALAAEVRGYLGANALETRWRWLGPERNVAHAYPRYDALLLPSLWEGVANTMCEAMACGLPVIVTDIADNRRIVRDGVDGFVCAPDDPQALANAMQRFCGLDQATRHRMGVSAHERAVALFAMDRLVDQWESLCRSLVRVERSAA